MLQFAATQNDEATRVSALLPIEACSAICRLRAGNRMTSEVASSALEAIAEEIQHLTVQPLTPPVLQLAVKLAERHALRTLDAVQLASAIVARALSGAADMRFVASDHELLKAAEGENFAIWNPAL